jgi:hypothetical protein
LSHSHTIHVRVRWAMGWTIGVLGFDSRRGLGIFFFTTASRPAVTHPASYPMGKRDSFLGGNVAGTKR